MPDSYGSIYEKIFHHNDIKNQLYKIYGIGQCTGVAYTYSISPEKISASTPIILCP